MTIRQDMLKAAGRARNLLGDSADLVANCIRVQLNPDGGFKNRFGQSDLYYTVFGIEALLALGEDVPGKQIAAFLHKFESYPSLDLVHLTCLIRCLSDLAQTTVHVDISDKIVHRLEKYRSGDGGYSNVAGAERGTAYGCFLALGAYQDLSEVGIENLEFRPDSVVKCVKSLQMPDGGFANEPTTKISSAPATAAALAVLHYLKEPVEKSSKDWLLSCFSPQGGFAVIPMSHGNVLPDLLSTATVLHALALMGTSLDGIKEQCLDFIYSLWSSQGGFRGSFSDDVLDCEYTYYGLLALGHLNNENENPQTSTSSVES
ncbi:MAG: terpene cyclase/mutase family protein [Sedimentisphaerales bacterium]|nr:terpene cyclase/mutase family protein [Sedimentisphaerales bacterium]